MQNMCQFFHLIRLPFDMSCRTLNVGRQIGVAFLERFVLYNRLKIFEITRKKSAYDTNEIP